MARSLALSTDLPEPPVPHRIALAGKGFRVFFLLSAIFAMVIIPSWLLILRGILPAGTYLDPITWHAHEMIFGYTTAVIAGFLLTAVGNWTGRETLVGDRLLALATLWLFGRISMAATSWLPRGVPAVVDLAFLPILMAALARPLIATGQRRHFVVIGVLAALVGANLVVHLEALGVVPLGLARRACLTAVDVVLVLILIILGRVLPMFSRNATQIASIRSNVALDVACVGSMVLLTFGTAFSFPTLVLRWASALTAILALARAWHWGARYALRQPLLWILHAGNVWLMLGLALRALPASNALESSLALHALTAGAIGSLTIGMMARVALGHTGRMLTTGRAMTWAFVSIQAAAFARVFVPLLAASWYAAGLWVGGALWMVGFGIYVVVYAPILSSPRVDGKAG
jgi:uncharacterized protein involved in response to NO